MNPGQNAMRRKPEGKKEKKQYNKLLKQQKRARMEAHVRSSFCFITAPYSTYLYLSFL